MRVCSLVRAGLEGLVLFHFQRLADGFLDIRHSAGFMRSIRSCQEACLVRYVFCLLILRRGRGSKSAGLKHMFSAWFPPPEQWSNGVWPEAGNLMNLDPRTDRSARIRVDTAIMIAVYHTDRNVRPMRESRPFSTFNWEQNTQHPACRDCHASAHNCP